MPPKPKAKVKESRIPVPRALAAAFGIAGAGAMNLVPWLAWLALAAGLLILLFDVRFEERHLAYGSPNSAWRRLRSFHIAWQVLLGVVFVGAFAYAACIWSRNQYNLQYQLCRHSTATAVNWVMMVDEFYLGIRLLNEQDFDIIARVEESYMKLNENASRDNPKGQELPVKPGAKEAFLIDMVNFEPNALTTDAPQGRIRYVFSYGRKGEALQKKLIIEGELQLSFDASGNVSIYFRPTREAADGFVSESCRIPIPG